MDINKLIARVKAILMTPKTEWPLIAAEPATVADLYKNYIVILAAIPAVFMLRSHSLVGALLMYIFSLIGIFVLALIVDLLAPTFDAQKNQVQALKSVGYAYTALWVAGITYIIPFLGAPIRLVAAVYSVYLLYLALPYTMKCPAEKAGGYTAVSIVAAIILWGLMMLMIAAVTIGTVAVVGGAAFSALGTPVPAPESDTVTDRSSSLGKLNAWSKKMEAAGKQMDAAQKSGDANAQGNALGAVMGAALGGGDQVQALGPDVLKPFVPDALAGLKRTEVSAERNGALGMQVSEARGVYSDGAGKNLDLEISDLGSAKGMLALAGWAGAESDKETDHGYDKTYKQDGRLVHEQWDSQSKRGEYSIVLGDRFTVKVSGNADGMDQLKAAVASLNLAGLEALKDQGVKKG